MQPSTAMNTPGKEKFRLVDLIRIVKKRKKLVLRATAATIIASVAYTLSLPNIYIAKTLILPSQDEKTMMTSLMGQLGGLANLANVSMDSANTLDLFVTMLKSESVKDPIIDRFKLMEVYKSKYRTDTYKALDKNTFISPGRKDGVITISVEDKNPKRAAEIANSYVEELGNLVVRLNVTGAGQNRSFLEKRLSIAKGDLAKAEEELKGFQSKNKAIQVTSQAEATIKGVADLRAQLALQEVHLATLRSRFTDTRPEVKSVAASVANLRAQIAKLESGGWSESSTIPSVASIPALGQEYVRLIREFKTQESMVELLTKQYEMSRLNESRDVAPFEVIQKAKVPEKKAKPERARIVITYTLTAFFLSLFAAFALHLLERMPAENKEEWKSLLRKD